MSNSKLLLEKTISGTQNLFLLQLIGRLGTFMLNMALWRVSEPALMGLVSVRLEPLYATVLFLSRENIRLTILRKSSSYSKEAPGNQKNETRKCASQSLVNLAFVAPFLGVFVSIAIAFYMRTTSSDTSGALPLYLTAACIELLSEPFLATNLCLLDYAVRAKIEGIAKTMQCLVLLLTAYFMNGTNVLLFAWGQITMSMCVFIGYFWAYSREFGVKPFLPAPIPASKG
jgi:oligosaccharide translocation protein RFT1